MRTELGKIKSARFGLGGYQEVQIGFWLEFGGDSWAANSGEGAWSTKCTAGCQWTEADRIKQLGEISMRVLKTLNEAKKKDVASLVGVPVECTFEGQTLQSWRILKEVL